MRDGLEGLPESQLNPPHNLKTLASWLYMTYGLSKKVQVDKRTTTWLRPTPSIGSLYPCEIYVAAFAIDDLEPGLYHFSPRTFSLYKLREGLATLYQLDQEGNIGNRRHDGGCSNWYFQTKNCKRGKSCFNGIEPCEPEEDGKQDE